MRFFIIYPLLLRKGMHLQMNELLFLCLCLAAVFITAAGYVINDYFDTRTDLVNRPQTVIVGRTISRRAAIILHWALNAFGVLLGIVVSIGVGRPFLALVFLFIPGLLWFYSTIYKRQFLIGNVIVAALTALVPLMALLFELPLLYTAYWDKLVLWPALFNDIIYWVSGYSFFAFLLILFREIVKDIEDFEGDSEFGRNTLPVVLGIKNTQMIAGGILLFTIVSIAYIFGAHLNFLQSGSFNYFTFIYMIVALIAPIFYLLVKLFSAECKDHYHKVSTVAKYVMLSGILYSVFFRFFVA
jgi:4-hydroxybenzoate polyprenyltransferase